MRQFKKWISGLLAICMILSLCPTTVVSAHEHSDEGFADFTYGDFSGEPLWKIGNVESWGSWGQEADAEGYEFSNEAPAYYSDGTATVADGAPISVLTVAGVDALTTPEGEGWSFDAETATLTLNNFYFETDELVHGIYAEGDLNIHVIGENIIYNHVAEAWDPYNAAYAVGGIWVVGNLTIQGMSDGEDALISDCANLQTAIYADGNLEILDCEYVFGAASFISIAGGTGLTVSNCYLESFTPDYTVYRATEIGGFPIIAVCALGSMGPANIHNSVVNVEAGLTGILGLPLTIEESVVNTSADAWPIYSGEGCFGCYNSELTATNTLPEETFEDFLNWIGCPYLVGIYSEGGVEIDGSQVIAAAPHFGILDNGVFVAVVGGSYVEATGGFSGICAPSQVYIEESGVYAKATYSLQEMLAYADYVSAPMPSNGIMTVAEDSQIDVFNAEVLVEGGFYGLASFNLNVQDSWLEAKDSVYPIYAGNHLELVYCSHVYADASEEMLKEYLELTGMFDMVGAIQCQGNIVIYGCDDLIAEGTMIGVFSYNSNVNIEESNATIEGGAYGITGWCVHLFNSTVQADAVWTEEDFAYWGNGVTMAVYSGDGGIELNYCYPANGETVLQNGGEYAIVDSTGYPVSSVTILPGEPVMDIGLVIGGVSVPETSFGDGWSFNAETSTLTLDGFDLDYREGYGIYAEGDLTIVLKGENTITTALDVFDMNNPAMACAGIWIEGSLTIDGTDATGESLIVDSSNMQAAIYARNVLSFYGCDDVKGESGFISVFGASGFECVDSKVEANTPDVQHYMNNNLGGMHPAMGAMGDTHIQDSEITVTGAGLVGLMGEPLTIENSNVEINADAWGVFTSKHLTVTDSVVGVTNTMTAEEYETFYTWTGGVNYVAAFAGSGGYEFERSFIVAHGLLQGIYETSDGVSILESQIDAVGSEYGIYAVGVTVDSSAVYATGETSVYSVGAPITLINCYTEKDEPITQVGDDYAIVAAEDDILLIKDGEKHVHSYNAVVTEPGCMTDGYTTYTCSCGDTYDADRVPAKGHTEAITPGYAPTCTEVGYTDAEFCTVCKEKLVAHEEIPPLGHAFEEGACTRCGEADPDYHVHSYSAVVTPPTCENKGYTTYSCTCNHTYVDDEVPALGHSFTNYVYNKDAACEKDGTETAECDRCGKTDTRTVDNSALGHTLETIYGYAASCTEPGLTDGSQCATCGVVFVQQQEIPAKGHVEGILPGYAASCTENGWTNGTYCPECQTTLVHQEQIPALGHSFTDYIYNEDATCEEDGTETAKCDRCEETDTRTAADSALGHIEETIPGKAATCTETGLTDGKKCSVCGETLVAQEVIPALGHSFTDYIYNEDATCEEDGTETAKCDRCDETDTRTAADSALGHIEETIPGKAATCTDTGLTDGEICSVCGETLVAQEVIPALGHSFTKYVFDKNATCEEDGTETAKCDRCDETNTRASVGSAYGHIEKNVYGKAATCTEPGLTDGKKCSVCDEILIAQEEIPALGHTVETIPGKAATCTEAGITDGEICSVCKVILTAQVEITSPGHRYEITVQEATCQRIGYTLYTCHCGNSYVDNVVPALEHTYTAVVTAPTCLERGYTTYTCVCGDSYVDNSVEALGHSFANGICSECRAEAAPIAFGSCGTNVEWVLTEDGVLSIVGTTEPTYYTLRSGSENEPAVAAEGFFMDDFASLEDVPWAEYADMITSINIGELVASIGKNAFAACSKLDQVIVGEGVSTIGESAFAGCEDVTVTFNGDAPEVAENAFEGSTATVNYPEDNDTWGEDTMENCGGDVTTVPHSHTYTATVVDPTCAKAGYTIHTCSCGDSYRDSEKDALGHTPVSTEAKAATCTEPGMTAGVKCATCGEVLSECEEIPALDHTVEIVPAVNASCDKTGLTEGEVCSICGVTLKAQSEIPTKSHTEETVPGEDATCTEPGWKAGTKCADCGETIVAREFISPLGHTEKTVPGKEATCTEPGLTDGKICSVCGETLTEQSEIPAKGHTDEDKDFVCDIEGCGADLCTNHKVITINGKDATCTEPGMTDGEQCSICGDILTEQESIPALGHAFEEGVCTRCGEADPDYKPEEPEQPHVHSYKTVVTDPTCEEKGYTTYTCECGDTYDADSVPALGHSFTEYVSNEDATCEKDGTETAKCDRCDATDTRTDAGSALDHEYEDGVCGNCGEADPDYKPEEPEQPHVHSYKTVVTDPTCDKDGYTTYTCECGDTYDADSVPALGHSFTEYVSNEDATCEEDGTETAKCDRCDATDTRTVAGSALGHDYEDGICGNCGESDPDYKPETPEEPENPDQPEEPEKPNKPGYQYPSVGDIVDKIKDTIKDIISITRPDRPQRPTEPSEPEQPDEPTDPSEPGKPSVPGKPCIPGIKEIRDILEKIFDWLH